VEEDEGGGAGLRVPSTLGIHPDLDLGLDLDPDHRAVMGLDAENAVLERMGLVPGREAPTTLPQRRRSACFADSCSASSAVRTTRGPSL
jgi:hypothetical protein